MFFFKDINSRLYNPNLAGGALFWGLKKIYGITVGTITKIKDIVNRKPFGTLYKESQVQEDGKVIVIDQSKKDYIGFHNNKPSHNADIDKPMILFGDHSCKYKISR